MVGFWLLVTIAAFAAVKPAGESLSQDFTVPGREGFETNREIASIYGNGGDVAPMVPVVTLPEGTTIDSPGVAAELDGALAKVKAALPDARIASYVSTRDPAFVSRDRRTTYALVYIPQVAELEPGQERGAPGPGGARRRHGRRIARRGDGHRGTSRRRHGRRSRRHDRERPRGGLDRGRSAR